jgi:pyruvate-ferredoxin/flavodoxin oxidoreductase
MQTAFFAISGVLPEEKAMDLIKLAVEDTYGSKGGTVVNMNIRAAALAKERIQRVVIPKKASSSRMMRQAVVPGMPDFVQNVTARIIAGQGDQLPVSAIPADGSFPTGTTKWEKRTIATEIPVWEPKVCIQCNQCSFVCPHATIRTKVYDSQYANGGSPEGFKAIVATGREFKEMMYTVQVAPEDCTGCGICVDICPAFEKDAKGNKTERKAINMVPLTEALCQQEAAGFDYFLAIPDTDPTTFNRFTVKGSQLLPPLFEFSGACSGCGETPYVKLLTQLFGDRAVIANATGCSSIYGGNLPTTPYTTRPDGRGPAWSNSLFEDAAEFGLGMRLTVDKMTEFAYELLNKWANGRIINAESDITALASASTSSQEEIEAQRARVARLKEMLQEDKSDVAQRLLSIADYLVKKSVWIIGGDGWAYDIGYGGLDHVMASGRNVNVLLLDTGVYSNTGGQMSKATPRGAVAKFAAAGKAAPKKDLGLMMMMYGNVYVAQVAMGANMTQTVKAFQEAEAYNGPSLIIAYSHCIAHGINMTTANDLHKDAVHCGFWPLYRYNPLTEDNKPALHLDSKSPDQDIADFMYKQNRFRVLRQSDPQRASALLEQAREEVANRWHVYEELARG